MKNLERYKGNQALNEKELEEITKVLIQRKFDDIQKEKWAKQLANNYQVKPKASIGRRRLIYTLVAVAASLLLLMIAIPQLNFFQASTASLLAEYTLENPFPNKLVRKGAIEKEATVRLRLSAAEDYVKKDYKSAIDGYIQLLKDEQSTLEDRLYLGLAQLYSEQKKEAVQTLEKVQKESESELRFQEESNWFLALAYLKNEQITNAKTILESIVKNNHWRTAEAKKLLDSMK